MALTQVQGQMLSGSTNTTTTIQSNGTTAITIDSSQNVAIGTTPAYGKFTVYNNVGSLYHQIVNITRPSSTTPALFMGTNGNSNDAAIASNNSKLSFGYDVSGGYTAAQTIDTSANVLFGVSSLATINAGGGGSAFENTGSNNNFKLRLGCNSTGSVQIASFVNPNGGGGGITLNSTSTTFNTSSDYRLKKDVEPMVNALATVALLKPVTYKWKADNSNGQGFIAHELAEVFPEAVSGEKDAMETYVDEDGNEQTRISPQGIDTSFLVATLTAAIQELKAEVDSLKAQLEAK